MVATPTVAVVGTVKVGVIVPAGLLVLVIVARSVAPCWTVVVTVSPAMKPLPVTVTRVPLAPAGGLTVRAGPIVRGFTAAGPAACTGELRGATISAGTVLNKRAAVAANAAKLLRSEFKILPPRRDERVIKERLGYLPAHEDHGRLLSRGGYA
jgi:hypothetical protein